VKANPHHGFKDISRNFVGALSKSDYHYMVLNGGQGDGYYVLASTVMDDLSVLCRNRCSEQCFGLRGHQRWECLPCHKSLHLLQRGCVVTISQLRARGPSSGWNMTVGISAVEETLCVE